MIDNQTPILETQPLDSIKFTLTRRTQKHAMELQPVAEPHKHP
jgi:hypothetical protein